MLDWYDQTGIRRRETLPEGTTLKAAKDQLRKNEDQACKGTYIPESERFPFEKVAYDWLQYKKSNVRNHMAIFRDRCLITWVAMHRDSVPYWAWGIWMDRFPERPLQ